jgi:hypothetical protein
LQFYAFDAAPAVSLTLTPGGGRSVAWASFGPVSANITGDVVLANDGAGVAATDGCEALLNDVAGKIVLADRGECAFATKLINAQNAGAIGVIIANNVEAILPPIMGGSAADVTIPAVSISLADGNALKTALQGGVVEATIVRQTGATRDGGLDATIVAHEWGHYLHHRLVVCSNQQCGAQSEGWGDFVALHMSLRPGDDLSGVFAISQYASVARSADASYFGIRRVPFRVETRGLDRVGHGRRRRCLV